MPVRLQSAEALRQVVDCRRRWMNPTTKIGAASTTIWCGRGNRAPTLDTSHATARPGGRSPARTGTDSVYLHGAPGAPSSPTLPAPGINVAHGLTRGGRWRTATDRIVSWLNANVDVSSGRTYAWG